MSARLEQAMRVRQRAQMLGTLRKLAQKDAPAPPAADGGPAEPGPDGLEDGEHCDLCLRGIPAEHRHMLNLEERRIVCACDTCWSLRSGDDEYRPVGTRTVWLDGFDMPDEIWAAFQIPIGLAFFMHSSVTDCIVAMYPSPAGATESELHLPSWTKLRELNPVLDELEPDAEALVVNRMADPPAFAIAPIDRAYMLVGLIKANWQGISGGPLIEAAVGGFFAELRAGAAAA